MSTNFYNINGGMAGVDLHMYIAAAGLVPVSLPLHPHIVGATFDWATCSQKTIVRTVTSEGFAMLQNGHEICLVPHLPILFPFPHAAEAGQIGWVFGASTTTAVMSVHSVTGQGEPLATCLKGAWGVNENCDSPFDAPTGVVHNSNSVQTTPTAGDYANAALGVLWSSIGSLLPEHIAEIWEKAEEFREWVDMIEEELEEWLEKEFWWKHTEEEIHKKREEIIREILGG